ncbi:RPM1-interacting protein 4-like [Durio zibethinus]|uniref:RPM1-interacting protein 4-like n=1 Tax=Durio zibethinus TaxID=66656 RepID=A0A6P5WF37_DURZI|nr:RPM1-interacting protein 4-like [Durio zibethinus]
MDLLHIYILSHVPKIGDWDNHNLPYTTYFENARKENGAIRMNINDSEENLEAFMYMRGGHLESNCDFEPVRVPLAADSNKSILADKNQPDGQSGQNATNRNGSYDHQMSARSHRRMASESGSEKSNSDYSHLQSNYRGANSSQKKGPASGSSFSSSVPIQSQRSSSNQFDGNKHQRTTSIPKFGEWDENDPTSGEGFTVIFNKVKQEKQAPFSNFLIAPPQPSNYSDCHQNKRQSPSRCSKICCCLFSRGSCWEY